MIVDPKDLNQAYAAYKADQIMRKDMFRIVCDHIIDIDARLKAIEAAEGERLLNIATLTNGVDELTARLDNLGDEIDTKVATAANSAVNMWRNMNGEAINTGPVTINNVPMTPPKRRGRPPRQPESALDRVRRETEVARAA